mmetsp:Transcript_34257/g.84241  ORF Transcript_34257/g.84241 Transcript_34257/m.84241 type:complete len:252 (+) Transcript_34257:600-1355(+)
MFGLQCRESSGEREDKARHDDEVTPNVLKHVANIVRKRRETCRQHQNLQLLRPQQHTHKRIDRHAYILNPVVLFRSMVLLFVTPVPALLHKACDDEQPARDEAKHIPRTAQPVGQIDPEWRHLDLGTVRPSASPLTYSDKGLHASRYEGNSAQEVPEAFEATVIVVLNVANHEEDQHDGVEALYPQEAALSEPIPLDLKQLGTHGVVEHLIAPRLDKDRKGGAPHVGLLFRHAVHLDNVVVNAHKARLHIP